MKGVKSWRIVTSLRKYSVYYVISLGNDYWYRFFKTKKLYLLDESYNILIYTLVRDPPEYPTVWYPIPYTDVWEEANQILFIYVND